jgi:hypothetical protein
MRFVLLGVVLPFTLFAAMAWLGIIGPPLLE